MRSIIEALTRADYSVTFNYRHAPACFTVQIKKDGTDVATGTATPECGGVSTALNHALAALIGLATVNVEGIFDRAN